MSLVIKRFSLALLLLALSLLTTITSTAQNTIQSTNQGITFTPGQTITYCEDAADDLLVGINPAGKTFAGPGITDNGDGTANFSPSSLGVGNYTIRYNQRDYFVVVTTAGPATLAVFSPDEYCVNDAAFALSGGDPVEASGKYYVNGVEDTQFDPATANIGINTITYSVGATGCMDYSDPQTITVYALTPTTLNMPSTNACVDGAAFALSGGSPAGGTYDIDGTPAVNIDPAVLGVGSYTVSYTYTNAAGCANTASQTFTVNPPPTVSFAGLIPAATGQCDTDPITNLVGNQAGGIFSGNGITNTGIGMADFNPATSGLGYHDITYTYTDANGCSNSTTQTTRVGTEIFINGLDDNYCQTDNTVSFNYTPYLPFHADTKIYSDGVAGSLVDNGSGNADFIPSVAGVSTNVITYEFWDDIGCMNVIDKTVVVAATPDANFTGLNAALAYCGDAVDLTLTGNFAPSGTFTGPAGALTDNGDGTATFSPSALAAGTYNISYSYTNASNCTDTETKSITILQVPGATLSGDNTICEGDATPLDFVFTGGTNYDFTYTDGTTSWDVSNVTSPHAISVNPVNSTSYAITNVAYNSNNPNACTSTGSGSATIVVNPQVVIITQPTAAAICEGDNATFTVSASGQDLSYQWFFDDGVNPTVSLGTSASQPINSATASEEGNYYCVVSSSCGGPLTTNSVALSIIPNTSISTQPQSAIKCYNSSISLNVVASGQNLNYQWQKDGVNIVDAAGKISGSTTDNLVILSLNGTDAADYTCIVTGDCGIETSNPATLQVNDPTVITSQPTSKTSCENGNVAFTITASGTDLSYQWYFNDGTNPTVTLGTLNSQPVNNISAAEEGTYYCEISNSCGAVTTSNLVTLSILESTSISSQPIGSSFCEGANYNLSVSASGSNLLYQWYKDGIALVDGGSISGSNNPNLALSNVTIADAGNYRCTVTGDCGTETSTAATISIEESITFNTQPTDQTICSGNNANFNLSVNGSNPVYDWEFNTASLGAADAPNLTITNVQSADAGNYRCKVSNGCGDFYSNEVQLTVQAATAITSQPTDVYTCEGNDATFTVTASGSNLNYSWFKDGAAIAPAETNSTLNITNISTADNGSYACNISGTCGSVSSIAATLDAAIAPVITLQPLSQTACEGEAISLITSATGSSLSYQWYKDGAILAGETNPVISFASFAAGDEGSFYCIISNSCQSLETNHATITLGSPAVITSDPVSATRCINTSVVFTVDATGSNLSYQWYKDGVALSDDGRITATNSPSLSITAIALSDFGEYTCDISSDCNLLTSNGATLTVRRPTVLTSNPVSDTICAGGVASFNVSATGDNLLYQWQKDGTAIAGANSSSLILNPATAADEGIYNCQVSNSTCGFVTSAAADLVVFDNLSVTDPTSVTACEGSNVSFSAGISGPPDYDLSIQWYVDGLPLSNSALITGVNSETLNINSITTAEAGSYQCEVTSRCGTATTNIATLSVDEGVSISVQPASYSVAIGNTASFTVIASGNISAYQWRKDGVDLSDGGDLSGTTTATLTIANTDATDAGAYTCYLTGLCSSLSSNPATLTIIPSSLISVQAETPVTKCAGESLALSITSTGTTFAWRKDGAALLEGGNISGSNTPSLTISNLTLSDQGAYTCLVDGIEISQPSIVTVNEATSITLNPLSYTKCEGDNLTLSVAANGSNLSYQWQKDNTDIAGATNEVLSLNPLALSDAGNYHCVVTGTCDIRNSDVANLAINESTSITSQPVGATICENNSTTLSLTASGTNLNYQWYKNGSLLADGGVYSGASTKDLSINNAGLSDGGTFNCLVQGDCSSENSTTVSVQITPAVQITSHPVNREVCEGNSVTFSLSGTGDILSYQWYKDGVAIPAATAASYTLTNVTVADAGAYSCTLTGTCTTIGSNPATLTVASAVSFLTQPNDLTVCEDNYSSFAISTSGSVLSYQWQKDGTDLVDDVHLTGSTSANLEIEPSTSADAGSYRCLVQGTCGNTASTPATLSIEDSTRITAHPANLTIVEGSNAWFNVIASGTNLSYQWQYNGVDLADGGNISGTNSALLSVSAVSLSDEGAYQCIVSGSCGAYTSNPGYLTLDVPVTITTQPTDVTACVGDAASFSVVASGTSLSYQWKRNGIALSDNGIITGATTANLVITNTDISHAGTYTCTISGSYGSANSLGATLTVNEAVSISRHPADQEECEGNHLVLDVEATGNNLSYQWQKDNADLVDDAQISGSNSAILIIADITNLNEGSYRCLISNTCDTALSDPASITIPASVSITDQPVSQTRCVNQTANFTVSATGTELSYQWYKDGAPLIPSANNSGDTTRNLLLSNLSLADAGNYMCYISDQCGTVSSAIAQLSIKELTTITTQPADLTACEGSDVLYEVEAEGSNLSYQWQLNGIDLVDGGDITGALSATLALYNVDDTDGGSYTCNISGGCNDLQTNPALLTVNLLPEAGGTITGSPTLCQGEQAVLFVVPEIANADSYIWSLPYGATIASGDSTRSIRVNFSETALSGSISVHGQNTCGDGGESPALALTVNQLPEADAGLDQQICSASTVLQANATSGSWSVFSGDAILADNSLYNTTASGLLNGDNALIWSVTQNGCTSRDTVVITNVMVPINAGDDQNICSRTTTLNATAPTSGAVWSVVSGAGFFDNLTSPTPTLSGLAQGDNLYAWTTNNNGCFQSDTVTVTNNRPLTPNGGPDQIIDFDETYLDANLPEAGTTGTWYVLSGSGSFADAHDAKTLVTNLGPGVNILLWAVSRGECVLGDTIQIENILIEDPEAGPNQTLCVNYTTLDADIPEVGVGEWSVISGAATFADKYNAQTNITNIGNGSNWLKWTVRTSGNGVEYDSVLIVNNQTSVANAGPDVALCSDSFTLSANTPVYGQGFWTLNSGSGNIADTYDPNSAIDFLGSGANELKWTITNAACISEDFVTITNNTSTVALAGNDQVLCIDSTVLLPNTPSIGVGSWSVIQGSATFNGNIATQLAPDTNIFQYNITMGTCSSSDTIIIINNKPTTPDAGYDQELCADSVYLGGNTPLQGTGIWTTNNGAGTFSSTSIPNPKVTDIALGDNMYRWTISKNGCKEYDDVLITNNSVEAVAGLDVALCENEYQLQASNPTPGIGTWSINGSSGAVFNNQNNPNTVVSNLSPGDNELVWTVLNGVCVSTDEVILTNNKPSTSFAGENQSICGTETILNANTPTTGSGFWTVLSGSGTFTDATDPHTSISNLSDGSNTVRWTITQENCYSFDDAIIINNQAEDVFAGNDQVVCADSASLLANPPSIGVGQWTILSGSGVFDDPNAYSTNISALGQGENILKWVVSSSDCHVSDTVIIQSNIPSTASAGADQIICSDQTELSGNAATIGSGIWELVSGSCIIEDPSNPTTSISSLRQGSTTLRWSIGENGCYSSDEMLITNNSPSTPFAGYDKEICSDSTRLFATPPTIGTGYWSLVSGDAIVLTPDNNQTSVANIKFGPNTFRYTTTNENCVLYDDVVITSNLAYVFAGEDQQVNTPSAVLIGNQPEAGSGEWLISASPATLVNPGNMETTVNNLGSGTNVFTWTITNNGCTASDDVVINYVVLPTADFTPSATKGCPPALINFVNTSIGGTPYLWDFGDGTTSTDQNVSHTFTETGTYTVVLRATGPLGSYVSKDTVITIYESPVADFDIAPETIYIPGQTFSCYNYSTGIDSSVWYFGDGNSLSAYAPTYTYTEAGTYDITLEVFSNNNCSDSKTVVDAIEVLPRSSFFFPDAFTPNPTEGSGGTYDATDRSNDVFYPIITDGDIYEYEFYVYNRTGVLLFQSTNTEIGWDGYYKGKMQPQDVYVYMVRGRYNNGEAFKKTGNVLLIVKDN